MNESSSRPDTSTKQTESAIESANAGNSAPPVLVQSKKASTFQVMVYLAEALLIPIIGYCAIWVFDLKPGSPPFWLKLLGESVRFNAFVYSYFCILVLVHLELRYRKDRDPEPSVFERDKMAYRDVLPGELLWKAFRRREMQAEAIKRQNTIYLLLGLGTSFGVVVVWFFAQKMPLASGIPAERIAGIFSRLLIVSFAGSLAILFIKEHISGISDYKDFLELRMRADAQRAVFSLYKHESEIPAERLEKLVVQILADSQMPLRQNPDVASKKRIKKEADTVEMLHAAGELTQQITSSALNLVNTAAAAKNAGIQPLLEAPSSSKK